MILAQEHAETTDNKRDDYGDLPFFGKPRQVVQARFQELDYFPVLDSKHRKLFSHWRERGVRCIGRFHSTWGSSSDLSFSTKWPANDVQQAKGLMPSQSRWKATLSQQARVKPVWAQIWRLKQKRKFTRWLNHSASTRGVGCL